MPRDGLRSCRVVNTKFVAFDGMQCSPVTRRVPTYGHRCVRIGEASHPGAFHRLRRCRDQCNQHAVPSSLGGDDYSVDDTVMDSSFVEATVENLEPPPSPTRETQLDPCRSESSADDDRPVWTVVDGGRRRGQNPAPHVAGEAPLSGTRRFFSGCSARNVARRVVSTPTQLDSDDEPLMATDVAPPVRSEVLEAFDLTIADSDASESSRATGEDRQEGSQQLGSALAVRASSHGVHCGRFAALLENDTERNNSPDREDATDQEFPARRRRRLRITWQEDAEVHESCMDRTVRGAEALIHNLAQRIGAIPVGCLVPHVIQRQRWSPLNVPIIWGAAGVSPSIPLIEWLVSMASSIHAPIQFHGGQSSVSDAIRNGWMALREVMRAWRVTTPEELSGWLRR